ncbi:MAG TPA: dihydrodipicolinate synthase family protein [Gemmatimonadales bacterium]|nr:dihydrodipicolinate synthase family protein [Gemmatimonadales bacterium]
MTAGPAPGRLVAALEWGVIPAVPVPFRGAQLADDALQAYAAWMAGHQVAGVAVWAHTGRGPHLSAEQRRLVLAAWRAALPMSAIIAGVSSVEMAAEARAGGADALLAFPRADDPVGFHEALGRELPVIAFYLYAAAGGVAYDNQTLHALLALPNVIGIKVATLDSVVTFQRIAGLMRDHPDKLLITGEDRFLGYSLTMGARAALIGLGAALTSFQVALIEAFHSGDFGKFVKLSGLCDRFASATFVAPIEGYVRRMLWALAADGVIPDDACDDPWGPQLPSAERDAVRRAVREARGARISVP